MLPGDGGRTKRDFTGRCWRLAAGGATELEEAAAAAANELLAASSWLRDWRLADCCCNWPRNLLEATRDRSCDREACAPEITCDDTLASESARLDLSKSVCLAVCLLVSELSVELISVCLFVCPPAQVIELAS